MFVCLLRASFRWFTALLLLPVLVCTIEANDVSATNPRAGDKSAAQAGSTLVRATRILFLGNSITRHGPAPKIGWTGDWGMAASEEAKDYVHVLVQALAERWGTRPEFQVHNIATFERQYASYDIEAIVKAHQEFQPDIVVVAIGENVPGLGSDEARAAFKSSLLRLFTGLKENGQPEIVVRSCFWPNKAKDDALRQACEAVGGVFVDNGQLGKDESNYARSERDYAHAGVAAHPGDRGMKAIADTLFKVIAVRDRTTH